MRHRAAESLGNICRTPNPVPALIDALAAELGATEEHDPEVEVLAADPAAGRRLAARTTVAWNHGTRRTKHRGVLNSLAVPFVGSPALWRLACAQ